MAPRPVFLHGAGGGTFTWVAQEHRFEGCCVLALPGHPDGTALTSVGGNAEWLAHTLRDLPGSNVVIGHSLGGTIALQLALIAPELVSGLVLVSSAARYAVPEGLPDAARNDVRHAADRLLRRGWPEIGPDDYARELAHIVDNGAESLARDYTAVTTVDLTSRLHEVDVPTLVVVGADDVITPHEDADLLASGIADATLVQIPDVGHFPMLQTPETLSLVIAGFLAHVEVAHDA